MRFLLDTNVISELRAKRPEPRVVTWVGSLTTEQIYLSVLTVGEIRRGIAAVAMRDADKAERLADWLKGLVNAYGANILPVNLAVAEWWGTLTASRPHPAVDGLLAATAYEHGLTVATRNTSDFADLGVALFNPFA
jgi:predicted nucleic acid-binding protein